MPKNLLLLPKTRGDIDRRVERVLRELGSPEPPLRLADVRELLRLDLAYYRSDDPGIAREAIHRIRVGAIQVFQRPSLLIDVIKKFSLKALYLPDRKRIMLDGSEPKLKHRWSEAHEVGHSLCPWHEVMMHGDNSQTMSTHCREHVEAEANYAAGRMLFFQNRFVEEARSSTPNLASVIQLWRGYGNTLSSTLWRFVESVGEDCPVVGMMSCHPHVSRRPIDFDPSKPCRHFIQSPAFAARFAMLGESALFNEISSYCGSQSGGPLGAAELLLPDDAGTPHWFYFETFYNRHDALTLGVYKAQAKLLFA